MTQKSSPHQIRGSSTSPSIVIAVGGGKGGVGKSFLSSNLGIFLANMGFNTVLVDLDLGAPNLHTTLGEPIPKISFHDFLRGKIPTLQDTALSTQFRNLRLISGSNDHNELANISILDQSKLMSNIFHMRADFTILDLSAGTHTSTLDFFNMAHRHLVTITPDPTSIENAYRFMKASFYRKIKRYAGQLHLEPLIADIMSSQEKYGVRVPADLLNVILKMNPERGKKLTDIMDTLSFELILNEGRSSKDIEIARSIETVGKKYFGIGVSYLGHIDHDNAVWHSLRKRRALILEFPQCPVYSQILAIARDLASPHLKKAVV